MAPITDSTTDMPSTATVSKLQNGCRQEQEGHEPSPSKPPKILIEKPLETQKTLLVGGGPTNPQPRVLQVIANQPLMGMGEDTSLKIIEEIKGGLRYVFQTETPYTFAITGGGSLAVDVVLDNLIEPGDHVLVLSFGQWGQRAAESASRFGGVVKALEKPLGSSFTLEEIEEGILLHRPSILHLTNGESTTGVHQRVQGVGDLCRKHDCLLVVDACGTIGISPFYMDAWKVDAAFCNSQKGITSIAGTAPIAYGRRAMNKILKRKTRPRLFITDLKHCWLPGNYWGLDDPTKGPKFHSSYPIPQLYGLRESLAIIAEEGLEGVWQRHESTTRRLCTGLERLGMQNFVPDPKDRLIGTTVMNPPEGVDAREFALWIRQTTGVEINLGLGPTFGKTLRIGIFGTNASPQVVDQILQAVQQALEHFGVHQ